MPWIALGVLMVTSMPITPPSIASNRGILQLRCGLGQNDGDHASVWLKRCKRQFLFSSFDSNMKDQVIFLVAYCTGPPDLRHRVHLSTTMGFRPWLLADGPPG